MFSAEYDGQEFFIPMIDARRMEVYTAVYDTALNVVAEPQAMILDSGSFAGLLESGRAVIVGNGAGKASGVIDSPNAQFMSDVAPLASGMIALAEQAWHRRDFIDTAYSTPLYIKDFQALKPRRPF